MAPIHTGVDRAELRLASSPLSRSLRPNGDVVEHDDEPDENPESRWKRLYLQEQRKRLNTRKQRNEWVGYCIQLYDSPLSHLLQQHDHNQEVGSWYQRLSLSLETYATS